MLQQTAVVWNIIMWIKRANRKFETFWATGHTCKGERGCVGPLKTLSSSELSEFFVWSSSQRRRRTIEVERCQPCLSILNLISLVGQCDMLSMDRKNEKSAERMTNNRIYMLSNFYFYRTAELHTVCSWNREIVLSFAVRFWLVMGILESLHFDSSTSSRCIIHRMHDMWACWRGENVKLMKNTF